MAQHDLNIKEWKLLDDFNNRVPNGYEQIYLLYANSLNLFVANLYGCASQETEDAVEDVFVNLWLGKSTFLDLKALKSYLYVSARNNFLNYKRHNTYITKYSSTLSDDDFVDNIIEVEIYSAIAEVIKLLPSDCAEVLKKYLEGYKPAEIASILGRTEQSVYKAKHKSLSILKSKLTRDKLLMIISLIN